jgi:hypothetical protein
MLNWPARDISRFHHLFTLRQILKQVQDGLDFELSANHSTSLRVYQSTNITPKLTKHPHKATLNGQRCFEGFPDKTG